MATMNNRPDYWLGLALNRDANDGAFAPWWLDWTAKFRKVTGLVRGRNFELDRAMSSDPSLFLRDPDETLNPENTSSPYAGMVLPYREACLLQQWPNQPIGGAVNLFNAGTWRGNKEDARDGSFESFAVGAAPSWLTAVRAATGLGVTSGAAFQGSQKASWSTNTISPPQGVQWPVACIPGRQYTVSAYLSQDTASTYGLDVAGVTTCTDPFMPRTVSNGWGTPTFVGPAYTTSGGAAADYSVSGGYGIQAHPAVNTLHACLTSTGSPDHTPTLRAVVPVVPTGAPISLWCLARWTDVNNFYVARLDIGIGGQVTFGLYVRSGGVDTTIFAPANQSLGPHYAGDEWNVSLAADGYQLNAFAWKSTSPQVVATISQLDFTFATATVCGIGSRVETGNTNTLPLQVKVSDFQAIVSQRGSTTNTTGAGYTRLSCTFTATQPSHQVRVVTRPGTQVAGAVRLDAIQHEQGAAPSTYTTSGPVIYPGVRHNVEQWPREYEAAGFLGVTDPPGVDAFASLNAISLRTEYQQAVLNLGPDYFYPLSDGTQTLLFSDQSGQGRTPLAPLVSKTGAGPGIAAGTSIAIPGDPGASGVKFTYNPPVSSAQQGIILGNLTPVALPVATGMPYWACTIAGWFQVPTGDPNGQVLVAFNNGLPGTAAYLGVNVIVNQGGSGALNANLLSGFSLGPVSVSGTPMDNSPHFFCFAFYMDNSGGGTLVENLWLDGVKNTAAWGAVTYSGNPATLLRMGGNFDYGGISSACNGVIADVGIWNRQLTDAEVNGLYAAGRPAFAGETSGTRSARHLTSGGFSGATRITTAGPATTMQPPSWTGQIDLLSDVQGSVEAEQGATWVAPDGAVVIETRNDRWLRLTPSVTFGENYAGGEVPYLMDGLRFVPDPLYVYANVTVERINGTAAVGGTIQDVSTARRRFFPRAVQLSADFATDALAQSCANWIFNTHSAPVTRVDALIIEPFANPALWPIALSLEPGKRVQFVRRAKAGNAGAGFTFARDFFVEKIDIPEINFATGVYQIRVQLSPINAGGAPSLQPWILNDTTYSVLNSTTILGW